MKHKKYSVLVPFCSAIAFSAHAQSAEIMVQQLTALESYAQTAENAYRIAEHGIHIVRNTGDEELNLHNLFFSSLHTISPAIKNMPALKEIARIRTLFQSRLWESFSVYMKSPWLNESEWNYITEVFWKMSDACEEDFNRAECLASSNALKMTDGERIRLIQSIETSMKQRYDSLLKLIRNTSQLILNRQQRSATAGMIENITK